MERYMGQYYYNCHTLNGSILAGEGGKGVGQLINPILALRCDDH